MPYVQHNYLAKKYLTRAIVAEKCGVGNLLREMRERSGMSQRALANVMGLRDHEISRWEKGYVMIGLGHFVHFVHACGHSTYVKFGNEIIVENSQQGQLPKAPKHTALGIMARRASGGDAA